MDGLHYDPRWRLIDLWNDLYLVGNACLGIAARDARPVPAAGSATRRPWSWERVCLLCLIYLNLRIRAVEIVK